MILFEDRSDAGRQLADRLAALAGRPAVVVLGIPRGGIVVAAEIARKLGAPLDVLVTHKIGAPFNAELAIGAVASDGTSFLDLPLIKEFGISDRATERERQAQLHEVRRREQLYRGSLAPLPLAGQQVILVDDGVATGSTTIAALRSLAKSDPARRVLAVPVAPPATAERLACECDELVLLATPDPFIAVGRFFEEFDQVSDEDVIACLRGACPPQAS